MNRRARAKINYVIMAIGSIIVMPFVFSAIWGFFEKIRKEEDIERSHFQKQFSVSFGLLILGLLGWVMTTINREIGGLVVVFVLAVGLYTVITGYRKLTQGLTIGSDVVHSRDVKVSATIPSKKD